jgi:hypothetical protein
MRPGSCVNVSNADQGIDRGRVDDGIQTAESLHGAGNGGFNLSFIRDVAADGKRVSPRLSGSAVQQLPPATGESDPGTSFGRRHPERPSDTGRSPHHEHALTTQIPRHNR